MPTRASTRSVLRACLLQIPLLVQFRQLAQTRLQFLPGRHALACGRFCPLRNVITCRLALLPVIADVQVWTVLRSPLLTMAAVAPAAAIGFRQRAENRHLRQALNLLQQLASLRRGVRRPGHCASAFSILAIAPWKTDFW